MKNFQFVDLHCHPNLKAFGQSFSNSNGEQSVKSNMWYSKPPTFITKCIQKILGVTRFSQADFTTMVNGNVKLAFVSLYPFEKGFFTNPYLNDKLVAMLSNFITSIGYNRVRRLQKHKDYFRELTDEYEFLLKTSKTNLLNNTTLTCDFVTSSKELEDNLKKDDFISIIPTIEGAHVFNTGLGSSGIQINELQILKNVEIVKGLPHPPLFITFAHNFNNDLCGHAPSLEALGTLVNQSENLNSGFTILGIKVLHALLESKQEKPIYIDVKHMSLKSRFQFYDILKTDYNNTVPVLVSHGAVTGRSTSGRVSSSLNPDYFVNDEINFYDEEILIIARSKGLFALQLDSKRLAPKRLIRKSIFKNSRSSNLKNSTIIIWRQLRHMAELLDANGHYSWGITCIGSDFDGTIDPLNEVWTSSDLNDMANELVLIIDKYLSEPNKLIQKRNKTISAESIVEKFTMDNALNFIRNHH